VAVLPQDTSISLSGLVGRDLGHLPIEAAFAVRGGLPELAALQAITLVPARLLGVEHRVGSLERGKDCDLIVTDGDLLHYETFVQYAVVEGKLVYDKEKEHYFAHIRPREEADVVPVVPQPVPEQPELP
jgi:imidazolonepropionase-like amidohydrolase